MMVAKLMKDEDKKRQAYENVRKGMVNEVHAVLKKTFRPEFLNRIDEIIIFESLTIEEIIRIVDLQIAELQSRLDDKKIKITVSKKAKELLAKNGFDPSYGARPLKRYIQQYIENPLALLLVEGKIKEGATVTVDEKGGEVVVK